LADLHETAYPRLKAHYKPQELAEFFHPATEEIKFCESVARGDQTKIFFIITLKCFQRLGYFIFLLETPNEIIEYFCKNFKIKLSQASLSEYDKGPSRRRHLSLIREYCGISAEPDQTRKALAQAVVNGAQTKEDVADIINVAIEELVRQRFELPAFGTIHRSAKSARGTVNRGYYRQMASSMTLEQATVIDNLFKVEKKDFKSLWDNLKSEPGKPSRTHFHELLNHLEDLSRFPFHSSELFVNIPGVKLQQFALEAKSLDAARMAALTLQKRYALAIAMIRAQRARCLDDLAEMFIKRMMKIHHSGQEALDRYHLEHRSITDRLLSRFQDVLQAFHFDGSSEEKLAAISQSIGTDSESLANELKMQLALGDNNYYSFLETYYRPYRKILFELINSVKLVSTTKDASLNSAMEFIKSHQESRSEKINLPAGFNIGWVPDKWWKLVTGNNSKRTTTVDVFRKQFEICVFSQILWELKSGNLCIPGSEQFSDYRDQLISWEEYHAQIGTYGLQANVEVNPKLFVEKTKKWLSEQAKKVDAAFTSNESLSIENGEPRLKRDKKKISPEKLRQTERLITSRLDPVNILDALVDIENWIDWTRPFGPLSGFDAKVIDPSLKYVLTAFCYGSNLGPTQTARSVPGADRRQIAWINQRHVTEDKLDEAIKIVINAYAECPLPKVWGSEKHASADGTRWNLYEQNLLSEYHIRYGGYGGIGYYHVSDTYIALFSHFIPCGVWEAVYILDGLLKNESEIRPDTLHADTQGQSAPVFALSHLLGIDLMPRIRNWKDLKFFRANPAEKYKHIDSLFTADVDWDLIETHLPDMLRIALSIRTGKISSSTILRRLGTYSRKNRLYSAFRELGQVVRTEFLLRYLSDSEIRSTIQAATNKSETFNFYVKWVSFGGHGIIAENSRDEQRKIIKYNHLVANILILHTMYLMSSAIAKLKQEGCLLDAETLSFMSPYLTEHINRYGDYRLNGDRHMPLPEYDLRWLENGAQTQI
jgi:TnpA family transposase